MKVDGEADAGYFENWVSTGKPHDNIRIKVTL